MASHYRCDGLLEQILQGPGQVGVDLKALIREDLGSVDEFHVRRAQVSTSVPNSSEPPASSAA